MKFYKYYRDKLNMGNYSSSYYSTNDHVSVIDGKSTVCINGTCYTGNKSVQVINDKIIIDGKEVVPESESKKFYITINVEGDVDSVRTISSPVHVTGNINTIQTVSGDVKVNGNISNNINTISGDIYKN